MDLKLIDLKATLALAGIVCCGASVPVMLREIAMAHVFLYVAIQRIGASISNGVSLVVLFVTLLLANVTLGETLSVSDGLAGSTMIMGGALLFLSPDARVRAPRRRTHDRILRESLFVGFLRHEYLAAPIRLRCARPLPHEPCHDNW